MELLNISVVTLSNLYSTPVDVTKWGYINKRLLIRETVQFKN